MSASHTDLIGKAGYRNELRRLLFSVSNIDRIHIIGCSRSGTTMLHLAFACFADVILSEFESDVLYPYLRERLELAMRFGWRRQQKYYVTKRNARWYELDQIDQLINQTRLESIGLVHLVRDPRDVMLSTYPGSTRDGAGLAYVSAEQWYTSILAADRVFGELASHPRKLVLRYEDVVLDPQGVEEKIAKALGMRRDTKALPINRIKDNFEQLRISFDPITLRNLNGLRNMDPNSIGRWRRDGSVPVAADMKPRIRDRFDAFCVEHNYI